MTECYEQVKERLMRYARINTESDPHSTSVPTTSCQHDLASVIYEELQKIGATNVYYDKDTCVVYGSLEANVKTGRAIGFVTHMDTAPDASGKDVKPWVLENYDGKDIVLCADEQVVLSPARFPELLDHKGEDLIVTNGKTLLGADDKAGIAEIMTVVEHLIKENIPHGKICIAFTPDEEVGSGASALDLDTFGADYAYTIDGGEEGEITYENFNACAAKFVINGFNVHPGSAKDTMVNALNVAWELHQMLPAADRPEHTEDYEGFYHLTDMSGNVEKAEMQYIVRDHDLAAFELRKKELQQLGNTVVVVEHDEEIMRAADYLIDIGPDAGRLGGRVVYAGPSSEYSTTDKAEQEKLLAEYPESYTIKYLTHNEEIKVPTSHRAWNQYIEIKGARMNNLRGIDVKIPLNVFTCVTGVSGSGKSSLIKGILYPAMRRRLDLVADAPGEYTSMEGDWKSIRHVEFVDQNPIGKSTRSNPATYLKAYDAIRALFANQPLAKQMGFTPQYFSFNTEGGRCEECKGAGYVTIEMQFMADLTLTCEACKGKRFKHDILEVRYGGKDVNDVLNMTVNEAIEFFSDEKLQRNEGDFDNCRIIVNRLKPLQDVGLGYIKLGQNSSSLSGGENQRVKLAFFIGKEEQEPTLFIFDEPTTGLHFHDIKRLLHAFNALIERGHSLVVIEHNLDVIKCADYIIDLGPEGGDKGGNLVVAGTPEEVAACKASLTGKFLR